MKLQRRGSRFQFHKLPAGKLKRSFLYCFVLFLSVNAFSQTHRDWRSSIDYEVELIDSLSQKSQTTFYLRKVLRKDNTFKNDQEFKETWHYTVNEGKVIIFQLRYVIESIEYLEVYYLDKGKLICMERYETPYMASYIDEVRRGQMFFFRDNSLKQYIVFGNRKQEPIGRSMEDDCLVRFQQRYDELQKTIAASNWHE